MIAAGQGYNGLRGDGDPHLAPNPRAPSRPCTLLLDRGVDVERFQHGRQHRAARRGGAGRARRQVPGLARRDLLKNKAGLTPLDIANGAGGRGGRGGVVREGAAAILRKLGSGAASRPSPPSP